MMLQAVAHDVKNKLAELALRLFDTDIEAAATRERNKLMHTANEFPKNSKVEVHT